MVRAVVSTMAPSAVSVSFPVRGPRKGGHGQKNGREPHGEHENRPLAHNANSIFTRAANPLPLWQIRTESVGPVREGCAKGGFTR